MKMKIMKKLLLENFRKKLALIPKSINYWSYFYVAPGWCDEKFIVILQVDLEKSELEEDIDEQIEVVKNNL